MKLPNQDSQMVVICDRMHQNMVLLQSSLKNATLREQVEVNTERIEENTRDIVLIYKILTHKYVGMAVILLAGIILAALFGLSVQYFANLIDSGDLSYYAKIQ